MKPDPPSDFGTLAEIAGDAEAAAVLRNAIEAIPDAIALPGLRRSLVAAIDGGAIRAPARLAAAAREVLAEAGIEAEVIERPDDRPIPPTPPAKNPAPERPRKRRKRRRRSRGRAGDAAAGSGQPRQPAPRSEAPEQSAEQRADLIAAERPREVADAIRANAAWLADRIDAEALPAKWRERIVDEPLALLAWRNQAGKPRIDAGNVLLRTPTSTYPGESRTLTEADAKRQDRALIDLAREFGVLIAAVDRLPRTTPDRAMLATVAGKLTRQPALDTALLPAIIEVAAVAVDGVPVASRDLRPRRLYRPRRAEQASLLPGPRTLTMPDGRIPFDPLLYAADGIEHPATRADVLHLARFCFALVRPMTADVSDFARLLTGKRGRLDARTDLPRARDALAILRGLLLTVDPVSRAWIPLAEVSPLDVRGERYAVGPPAWTRGEGPAAWRLTAGLFRPGLRSAHGGATFARRALDGIESALAWSPPRQRQRTAELLRPATGRTGPGPEVEIPARDVLRLAGREPENGDGRLSRNDRQTWHRVFAHLIKNGYQVPRSGGEAEAGDAVELVRRVGARGQREAALIVRASARFVEATRKNEAREPGAFQYVAARRLLPGRGD